MSVTRFEPNSESIQEISYDDGLGILGIKFKKSEDVYNYKANKDLYQDFVMHCIQGGSANRFYRSEIQGVYISAKNETFMEHTFIVPIVVTTHEGVTRDRAATVLKSSVALDIPTEFRGRVQIRFEDFPV